MALWIYEQWRIGRNPDLLEVILNHLDLADPIATWEELPRRLFSEENLTARPHRPLQLWLPCLIALRPDTDAELHAFVKVLCKVRGLYLEAGAESPPSISDVASQLGMPFEKVVRLLVLAPSLPISVGISLQEDRGQFKLRIHESIFEIDKVKTLDDLLKWISEKREKTRTTTTIGNHRVFVVHGQDETAEKAVAQFLEELDIQSVILHKEPNKGRTIIEKFEDYSDVIFAVILLTPDYQGGPISIPLKKQRPRARQNVILELGYFLGKLGRSHVCALYREGVDIPSDYSGVLYVPFDDDGDWKPKLARELRAADVLVDIGED